jgi:hypothetical protein
METLPKHNSPHPVVKITTFFPTLLKRHNRAEELTLGAEKRRSLTNDQRRGFSALRGAFRHSL